MKKLTIALLVLVVTLGFSGGALAETIITATGNGQVSVMPDMATLNLGVTATRADVGSALTQVNVQLSAVRDALAAGGVQPGDISVSDISVYTQYRYDEANDEDRIAGYTVSHRLSVKVRDTAALGALIDSAVNAGANQLNGISMSASNSEDAYCQALALAVKNARANAQAIAQAEGLELGELKELSESAGGYAYRAVEAASYDMAAGKTQVDVGSLTISASVTCQYEAE